MFSPQTLGDFEAASASIPMRQLDRAFAGAEIRLGTDPGGPDGTRRVQFRRYVASINQHDPRQLERLGAVLGALIDEVATSKQRFLIGAAERDGFLFADGAFRLAPAGASAFTLARVEDVASLDERGARLRVIANVRPADAIAGAVELISSLCRTIVSASGVPAPAKSADLATLTAAALQARALKTAGGSAAKKSDALADAAVAQLAGVVASFATVRAGKTGLAQRHARLAVDAALAFAVYFAETAHTGAMTLAHPTHTI